MDIKIKMNELRSTERLVKSVMKSQLKLSGIEKEQPDDSDSVTLDLSQEGRLMSENSMRQEKESMIVSVKERWENNITECKRSHGGKTVTERFNLLELFRLDEPETYAKHMEYWIKACEMYEAGFANEEEKLAYYGVSDEAYGIYFDWYDRKCLSGGTFQSPVDVHNTALNVLENMYSDSEHKVSFNFYGRIPEPKDSMWWYSTKFSVLISANMFNNAKLIGNLDTASDREKKKLSELMETIDKAVKEMKQAEKEYEGDLEYLRFGVKLWDDGKVTYHANYKDCENDDGIMADSIEELLEKLKSV